MPSTILLGLEPSAAHMDAKLAFVPQEGILSWFDQVTEPMKHSQAVREYCNYRVQTYDRIRQLSREKQERDAERYDAGVSRVYHEIGSLVMVYQKRVGKLEAWWREPFRVSGSGGVRERTWVISQLNGRKIMGTYHGDHLKPFYVREGYLSTGESFRESQTIRPQKKKKKGGR